MAPSATSTLVHQGHKVLLVGTAAASPSGLTQTRDNILASVGPQGSVNFEQLDRLNTISLPGSTYNAIVTGTVAPSAFQHSDTVLATLASTLVPGGGLSLTEPISIAPALAHLLKKSSSDLVSALKISGFVDITVVQQRKASLSEIQDLVKAWDAQIDASSLVDQIEFIE
ncbi:Anamorsin, partial [Podila epigama]